MIVWLIVAAYFMITLWLTKTIAHHYIDRSIRQRDVCVKDQAKRTFIYYHSDYCECRRSRAGITIGAFALSLLWPSTGPLYFIMLAPTKLERARNQDAAIAALQKENARLTKEILG